MTEWTGAKLAEHIKNYHKTTNPLILARIYNFEINNAIFTHTPGSYVVHDDGKKEILVNFSLPPHLVMFHVGRQFALYLLEHPDQIMGAD